MTACGRLGRERGRDRESEREREGERERERKDFFVFSRAWNCDGGL